MIASKGGDISDRDKAVPKSIIDKVVAIPFSIHPRRILYVESAKILDFIDWKQRHPLKAGGEAELGIKDKSIEELEKLSLAEQQVQIIKKLLEMYDAEDYEGLCKLYVLICKKSTDSP